MKNAAIAGGIQCVLLLAFVGIFALLIGNAAARLASGLAGGLTFAAAAVLGTFAQVTSFQSLDMFHCYIPPSVIHNNHYTVFLRQSQYIQSECRENNFAWRFYFWAFPYSFPSLGKMLCNSGDLFFAPILLSRIEYSGTHGKR